MLGEVEKAVNPKRAADALMGKYRVSTVRRYLGYWQKVRIWAEMTSKPGARPSSMQWVGYLYAKEEEGMDPSAPLAVSTTITWFQRTAGVEEEEIFANQHSP